MPPVRHDRILELAAALRGGAPSAEALAAIRALRDELDELEREHVAHELTAGVPLATVARELGSPRQTLHRRYRHLLAGDPPATAEVRLVLEYAREEAVRLGGLDPAGEHVVVAVLRMDGLPAAHILGLLGARLAAVRDALSALPPPDAAPGAEQRLLAAGRREADRTGDARVTVDHLLLAALGPRAGARRLLTALGVPVERLEQELRSRIDPWGL